MTATAPAQIRLFQPCDRGQVLALAPRLTEGVAPWRDPAAVRRKNFITEFPHTSPFALVYDSGNYDGSLSKALELVGYEQFRREQEDARNKGR